MNTRFLCSFRKLQLIIPSSSGEEELLLFSNRNLFLPGRVLARTVDLDVIDLDPIVDLVIVDLVASDLDASERDEIENWLSSSPPPPSIVVLLLEQKNELLIVS